MWSCSDVYDVDASDADAATNDDYGDDDDDGDGAFVKLLCNFFKKDELAHMWEEYWTGSQI